MQHLALLVILSCAAFVAGDMYMQNPRGSNNRLNEANTNRNNANRLFDSQNNGKGGYCWGPAMSFYEGSVLSIEWTNQHACGNPKLGCNLVFQFMCSADDADGHNLVRDGSTADDANTDRIPDDSSAELETSTNDPNQYKYGLHENHAYYTACKTRDRNYGLFLADRNISTSNGATRTRQNNNANRHGFECAEERDYYPYWHPSPWVDVAILTHDTDYCSFYHSESQNNKAKYWCMDANGAPQKENQEEACTLAGYVWKEVPANGFPGPDCVKAPWTRLNHLGNGKNGYAVSYNWTIPSVRGRIDCATDTNDCGYNCVLRGRYNISQADTGSFSPQSGFLDSNSNGWPKSPIYDDEIQWQDGLAHQLAMDTTQFFRTFQDRSHVFHIIPRPGGVQDAARIHNFNVRGKRGNIVQTYPATEYDFVPAVLGVRKGDYIHFQWTGCDTNPQGNAGEGKRGTDRSNIVQLGSFDTSSVASDEWLSDNDKLSPDPETRKYFAYAGQDYSENGPCKSYEELKAEGKNANEIEEDPANCMKLNAAKRYFNGGLLQMNGTGQHYIMSSRNNNFTNRGQKGVINISDLLPTWAIVLVAIAGAAFLASGGLFAAMMYAKTHEHSQVASMLNKF